MTGMRYLTNRCPAHLHDMVLVREGKFADLHVCLKCDFPILYVVDESRLDIEAAEVQVDTKDATSAVQEQPKPKPHIKRWSE